MIYLLEQIAEEKLSGREKSRAQSEAARGLLLFGLFKEYGLCELPKVERSEQGKPYFPEYPQIKFNYSHCGAGILCGISKHEIGVDVERRIPFNERLVKYICHENEKQLFIDTESLALKERLLTRFWTAKESYLKCTGPGIRIRMDELDFSKCRDGGIFQEEYQMYFEEGQDCGIAVCEKMKSSQMTAISVKRVTAKEITRQICRENSNIKIK